MACYASRAHLYEETRRPELAMQDYNSAIGLSPKAAELYIDRGRLKNDQGDREGALADIATAQGLVRSETVSRELQALIAEVENPDQQPPESGPGEGPEERSLPRPQSPGVYDRR